MSSKNQKKTEGTAEPKLVQVEAASQAVVETKTQLPAGVQQIDITEDAGAGNENVTAANMAIPLISILQGNSPQCKKSDPKYINGAEEGDLYNNVTEKLEAKGDQGLVVISCFYEKVFIEWKPKRGGFVAQHAENTPLRAQVTMVKEVVEGRERLVPTLPNGNILVETDQNYVLILNADGSFSPAVIPMSSSALRSARLWNTLANQAMMENSKGDKVRAPRFALKFKLTTRGKQKDTFSWSTWAIEPAGQLAVSDTPSGLKAEATDIALYQAARALKEAVAGGDIRVKQEQHDADEAGTAQAATHTDDVPLDI